MSTDEPSLIDLLKLDDAPLATLPEDRVRPQPEVLAEINASLA